MRTESRQRNRNFLVVGMVYASVLVSLVVAAQVADSLVMAEVTFVSFDIVVGVVACGILGRKSFRQAFGRAPDLASLGMGAAVPLVSLPLTFGYVALIGLLADGESHDPFAGESLLTLIVCVAVVPALLEEWLCRGVLWQAVRPVANRGAAIVATATPFAFMHIFGGGFLFELPHRFLLGVLLGWLRAKTGSLWPCVLAHFLHNAVAIAAMAW